MSAERLAALLREYGALVMRGREHDADKHAAWLTERGVTVAASPEPPSEAYDRLRDIVYDAQSVDGAIADDAPPYVDGLPPCNAWVEGYQAGQNSVQEVLDQVRAVDGLRASPKEE